MLRWIIACCSLLCLSDASLLLNRNDVRRAILSKRADRRPYSFVVIADDDVIAPHRVRRQVFPTDDEEWLDGSGELAGEEVGDGAVTLEPTEPAPAQDFAWQRTTINFLDSIAYSEDLQDYNSEEFARVADEIMAVVEKYLQDVMGAYSEVTPIMFKVEGGNVLGIVDVGTCTSYSLNSVTQALTTLLRGGKIGRYRVTTDDFVIYPIGIDPNRQECLAGPTLPPTTDRQPDGGIPTITTRTSFTTTEPRPCRADQATCSNQQCIDRSYLCDGTADCLDGSDEPASCSVTSSGRCDPTEFLCVGTGVCAQKTWRCDGDDDCGNGYDELNCPTASPNATCPAMNFECANRECVPASYHCDDEQDCSDGSDEQGCTPPVVVKLPDRMVNASEGDTIELYCEAVGVPTPVITWRVNWGNVPPPPRVTMSSVDGRGVLTIRKSKKSDQGAYTCEAINSKKGVLGNPDSIVVIEPIPETRCPSGEFATANDGQLICRPCYCFGVTSDCRPSKLVFSDVEIEFTSPDEDEYDMTLRPTDTIDGDDTTPSPVNRNQVVVNPDAKELQLIDLSKRFLAAAHYWSLPAQFLGAKIKSYGGTLSYSFSYNTTYKLRPHPVNTTDVILQGRNAQTLRHDSRRAHPEPGRKHTMSVALDEKNWKREDGERASREDMMGVLQDLKKVLVRTSYDNNMVNTGIGAISMQVATAPSSSTGGPVTSYPAGSIATSVEECVCPEGYEGTSCETCDTGYERETGGEYAGSCVRAENATRRECEVGYTGDNCTECEEGFTEYLGECTRYPSVYCNRAGSRGVGFGPCNCKTGCEGEACDRCKPGYFFLSELNADGCIPCYCSGVTDRCDSTQWNRTIVSPDFDDPNQILLTSLDDVTNTRRVTVASEGRRRRQPIVTSQLNGGRRSDVFYWNFRGDFVGNLLPSYGANLDFTVSYGTGSNPRPVDADSAAMVRLEGGDGVVLRHRARNFPPPDRNTRYVVPLREEYWTGEDGRTADRATIMRLLGDVRKFTIRATHDLSSRDTSITDVYLETAVAEITGGDRAVAVEQCSCPPGYQGLSCQECEAGYARARDATCERRRACDCNGHSDTCDPTTGICTECGDNTDGDRCETCRAGYFSDPFLGGACSRCPCPQVDAQPAGACRVGTGGRVACDRCPTGYDGPLCQRCAAGFEAAGSTTGSLLCRQVESCQCDTVGSADDECDDFGQCNCKASVAGLKCDRCRTGYFSLNVENELGGCLPCFCMGLTRDCSSSNYRRNQVRSDFRRNEAGFGLTDRHFARESIGEGFEVRDGGRKLEYPRFDRLPSQIIFYWQLPDDFLGDKIVSYGGRLQYTASYTTDAAGSDVTGEPDVVIGGNDITLHAASTDDSGASQDRSQLSRSVVFREQFWRLPDGQRATREHMLMALADLEYVLLRATYRTSGQLTAAVAMVAMETASESVLMTEPAVEVEQCNCPSGYNGLSCEDCAPGFTRSGIGSYLGLCEECQCNRHSDLCDPETGNCERCRDNTVGSHCERCADGYYGDATQGTDRDCRPCPCYGDGEPGFSNTCEASTGVVVCTRCADGYRGDRCELCAPGYEGDPTADGGRCRPTDGAVDRPAVTVTPGQAAVRRGSTVSLTCAVRSASPVTGVTWRRADGRDIPAGRAATSGDGRSLTIEQFSRADSGEYVCVASNRYGTSSDSAVISVVSRRRNAMRVRVEEPTQLRVKEGQDVTFVCTAENVTSGAYIVMWKKQGGRLPPSRSTEFDGVLHISAARLEDAGTYVCTGSNMHTRDRKSATLDVVRDEALPSVVVTPNQQSVSEGESAVFHCEIDGNPRPDVEWRRADGAPMPEDATVADDMLLIPSTSMRDKTEYFCRASNRFGYAEAMGELHVVLDVAPPRVRIEPPTLDIYIGDSVVVKCLATGTPAPRRVAWTRGDELDQQPLPQNIKQMGSFLRFNRVRADDAGVYTCTARNVHGVGQARIQVNIGKRVRKPLCRTEPKNVTAYVGTNSTIRCVVGGDPPPAVTWRNKDGTPLDDNMKVEGKNLVIIGVRPSNAGSYVCVATNENGASNSKMELRVVKKDLPKVSIEPGYYHKLLSGRTMTFTCLTDQPEASLAWKRVGEVPFAAGTTAEGGALRMEGVGRAHTGSYMCVASNEVGRRQIAAYLEVVEIPQVTVRPAQYIHLSRGESVVLGCDASGEPPPSVYWKKVAETGSDVTLTRYRLVSNEYHVTNAEVSDGGVYACVATNQIGTDQRTVTVMVRPRAVTTPPVIDVNSSATIRLVAARPGQLRCAASGSPAPDITWLTEGEFPPGSYQQDGTLHIPEVGHTDGGNYTCRASNHVGQDFRTFLLSIVVPPSLRVDPAPQVTLQQGDDAVITCEAVTGSDLAFEWTKEADDDATTTSSSYVVTSGAELVISGFSAARDAGTYTCAARNEAGEASVHFRLREMAPPVVTVSPQEAIKTNGESVEFACSVDDADPLDVALVWSRDDGKILDDDRVTRAGGVLRIREITNDDSGYYRCRAANQAGTTSAAAHLIVQSPPAVVMISNNGNGKFRRGDRLEISCSATGNPPPTISITRDGVKVDDEDGRYATASFGSDDAGVYTCLAVNTAGFGTAALHIELMEAPRVTSSSASRRIRSGDELTLRCDAEGSPPPSITWSKSGQRLEGMEGETLHLAEANLDDAGSYECTASNEAGSDSFAIDVQVEAFLPFFSQTPRSYVSIATPKNAFYRSFNISLTFRTNSVDGLLLYAAGDGLDFVSVSLHGGIVEFRFDVGSGPVAIRSREPAIQRGDDRWHRVTVARHEKMGVLRLDRRPPVEGTSPGEFRALDLNDRLYVGGVPVDKQLTLPRDLSALGWDSGFYGCVSQVTVGSMEPVDFGSSAQVRDRLNVFRCKTCDDDAPPLPCQHQAECRETNRVARGYTCACRAGFVGHDCQFDETTLCREDDDVCGLNGDCVIDTSQDVGYRCECRNGFSGSTCTTPASSTLITAASPAVVSRRSNPLPSVGATPAPSPAPLLNSPASPPGGRPIIPGALSFTQDSYAQTRAIRLASNPRRTDVMLRMRRRSGADGLLLYSGSETSGDFFSLAIRSGSVEFRFGSDTDVAIVGSSASAIGIGSWHTIHATRKRAKGKLTVDGRTVGKGKAVGVDALQLDSAVFVGGAKYWDRIPDRVGISDGFDGCIEGLRLDDVPISLDQIFKKKNTKRCDLTITPEFSGVGGTGDDAGGWLTTQRERPRHSARFSSTSYASYHSALFPHSRAAAEQISLQFCTSAADGLMLFHGEDLVASSETQSLHRRRNARKSRRQVAPDFVSLGVRAGHLVFSFDLGSGYARLTSPAQVADGAWHNATVVRRGSIAFMWLDQDATPTAVQSPIQDERAELETPGRIYIGGAPDVIYATAGRFRSGFTGCLRDVTLSSISAQLMQSLDARQQRFLPAGAAHRSAPLDFSRNGVTLERIDLRKCLHEAPTEQSPFN